MADPTRRPSSTTDYSSSQAPETQESAQHEREHDYRAIPGGDPARATKSLGMESLERGENVDTDLGQTDFGESRDSQAPPARQGQK